MIFFTFIYNGFVLGLFLSVLAFQSQWLEMRMNVGLIVFIAIIIAIIIYTFSFFKNISIGDKSTEIGSSSFYVSLSLLIGLLVMSYFLKKKLTLNEIQS